MTTKNMIQVCKDDDFRNEVAKAIVTEADPGYIRSFRGSQYADPIEGKVYFKEPQAAWNPWSDNISVVSVDYLVRHDGNDFADTVDWDIPDIPYRDMAIAYLSSEEEELEDNGDIPEWVKRNDVIAFARESEHWKKLIEAIEETSHSEAVSFAKGEILDEIELDDEL